MAKNNIKIGERCKTCGVKKESKRTGSQNRALWLWMTQLATALNDGGFTVQLVLKEKIDLDWDKDKVKDLLWRPAQRAILGSTSTTKLKKVEDIDKVYDHLVRHLGEKFGLEVPPFPSQEELEKIDETFIRN